VRLDESIEHDLTRRYPSLGSGRGRPPELLMAAGDMQPFGRSTGWLAVLLSGCGRRRLRKVTLRSRRPTWPLNDEGPACPETEGDLGLHYESG
jgi:hypothetical protein